MSLVPTRHTHTVHFPAPDQDEWCENTGGMSITSGWYVDLNNPQEEILIESTKSVLNQYGYEISTIEEEWDYDLPGCAPKEYRKKEYSRAYLPGIGGYAYRKVQEETVIFWTLTPLTSGDNLGRTRYVSGYVVYDLPQDPTQPVSSEGSSNTVAAGMKPGSIQDRIVETGRLWSESNIQNATVPSETAGQRAIWMENVVEEQDLVEEEWDKWTLWTMKKNALRSSGVEWSGPRYIRKEHVQYRLGVPIQPPEIKVVGGSTGISIDIDKGGAVIKNPWFGPNGTFYIRPERYKLYRAKVAEGTRSPDDNLFGMWAPGQAPAAPPERKIIGNDTVVDYSGGATSALPGQQSYTEPEDPTPEPPGPDTSFHLIATLENVNPNSEEGHADWFDTDCENGGEYEYFAIAEVRQEESTDSNHERATFSGVGHRGYRISVRTDEEEGVTTVDAVAPDDPAYPSVEFGELFTYEIPTSEDPLTIGTQIADRQFAARRQQDFRIDLEVQLPLLGLEFGQLVKLPPVSWEAFGNGIQMSTSVENDDWSLVGFVLQGERSQRGEWREQSTNLTLQQFPRVR